MTLAVGLVNEELGRMRFKEPYFVRNFETNEELASEFSVHLSRKAGNSVTVEELRLLCAQMRTKGHIAIFREPYLDRIMTGTKTIESRLTRNKIAPFARISAGDVVFLKKAAGPVKGIGIVSLVESFSRLNCHELIKILNKRQEGLALEDDFRQAKRAANYATFVYFDCVTVIKPFQLLKTSREAWVVLGTCAQSPKEDEWESPLFNITSSCSLTCRIYETAISRKWDWFPACHSCGPKFIA